MLKAVSLFCGCGGLDMGIQGGFTFMDKYYPKNKYKIVFANDIDKNVAMIYNANTKYFNHNLLWLSCISG